MTEAVSLRKGLSLYKQPLSKGKGSPNWYVRVYMPMDGQRLHTKSSKTTDLKVAVKFAEDFYGECLVRKQTLNGANPPSASASSKSKLRFDKIVDQWLDQMKLEAGDDTRAIRRWKDCKGSALGESGFARYFAKDDVNTITTDRVRDFIAHKKTISARGNLAATTIKRNIVLLNVALKFAYEKRLLASLPMMPKIKTHDRPRAWFEKEEYDRLYKAAGNKGRAAKKRDDPSGEDLLELADFITFMVSSFLRPGEWPRLQNKHVRVVENAENPHLELTIDGKTGKRKTVTMQSAVAIYKRIIKRSGKAPEAYLFKAKYPNRQTAIERMADAFEALLTELEMKVDANGEKRSTYSLRHTALMFRFKYGENVDILALAKNAGTSVDQLERFYLKRINVSDKISNLQSVRKQS